MRAIVAERIVEDLSGIVIKELPEPVPAAGQVLVRVEAASLNPVDWQLARGEVQGWPVPHVLGLDAAGTIEAIGSGVSGWRLGDRVVWHGNLWEPGVFAEFAVAPAHVVSRVPDGVDSAAAAAVPCAGYTAYQGLVLKARIGNGDIILIQGASGGVGGFGVQVARLQGATVLALARPEQAERVRALGAHHVIDYRAVDLKEQVRALTPGRYGADVMLEVVKPSDARQSLELLRFNGQLVTADPLPNLAHTPAYTYACSIHEVALGAAYSAGHMPTQCDFARMGDYFMQMLLKERISPMIEHQIGFDQIPDYLIRMRAGAISGKVVARTGISA